MDSDNALYHPADQKLSFFYPDYLKCMISVNPSLGYLGIGKYLSDQWNETTFPFFRERILWEQRSSLFSFLDFSFFFRLYQAFSSLHMVGKFPVPYLSHEKKIGNMEEEIRHWSYSYLLMSLFTKNICLYKSIKLLRDWHKGF